VAATTAPDPLAGLSGPLGTVWDTLELSQQRAVLDRVLDAVVVGPAVRGRNRFDPDRVGLRWRA
jgi:hypothetical protein